MLWREFCCFVRFVPETRPQPPSQALPPVGKERHISLMLKALGRRALQFDPPIPKWMEDDPETARRAHLTARFGLLGSVFGIGYAAFYLGIGHIYGALIILVCSGAFSSIPAVMPRVKRVETAGNILCLTMAFGFCALCGVEGGLHGHAIAWLMTVPLCALLLVGRRMAHTWVVGVFVAAALIAGLDLAGRTMPVLFSRKWEPLVSSAGYLGLIIFMYALGLIFENSRARAFGRMKKALEELAATNENLVRLNQEKNEFLGIAAHDLKNPLSVILGCAEMITICNDPGITGEMTEKIMTASTRMRNLISDLLDANAIEQGKFASKIERFDLSALVCECVENNRTASDRKNITLSLGAIPGLWAKADKAAAMQILDNLVSNALKFSPPFTTVQVHAIPAANNLVVMVRDEGPGLSEEDQKKLFGKFTRLTARPTGGESSTGLGLSIVKRLAEAMHGTVTCSSMLGHGATFSLRLPAWPKEEPAPLTVMSAPAAETISFAQIKAQAQNQSRRQA